MKYTITYKTKQLTEKQINQRFRYVLSDDFILYDDMYELIDNEEIYIQVNDDFGYIVHRLFGVEDGDCYTKEYGTYKTLSEAQSKAISLNK